VRICSPQLGLDPAANLGGAVYDRELLKAMLRPAVELSILLPKGERVDAGAGWEVHRTRRHRWSYYEYNWIFHRALGREYERQSFDLLRVHSPYSIGPGALAFARRTNVPAVLHYLHVEPRRLWQTVDRLTLRRYAHVVTISHQTKTDLLAQYDLAPEAITVAHPGISDSYVPGPPNPALRGQWGDRPVLLFVGSLVARKRVGDAIEAVARLRAEGVPVRLVIVGTGDEAPRLRELADRHGVQNDVEFAGRVDEPRKLALLRTADVFVFPSRLEGFGMAPAEAMACGMAVVAANSGPIPEIIRHGESGWLFDVREGVPALVQAIKLLLGDDERRRRLRAGAIERARTFSWHGSADRVLAVYREVLARGGR
jgi:glycosyltransferase involved in cell wall biosynthesis